MSAFNLKTSNNAKQYPTDHHRGINFSWNQFRRMNKSCTLVGYGTMSSVYEGAAYDMVTNTRITTSPSERPYYKKPLLLHEGRKQWLWDHKGRRYLDMFGGIVTVGVGHSHPKVVEAAARQISKLGHTTAIYMHSQYHEYVEKLKRKLPERLDNIYLVNSGTEANELAILIARLYTGAQEIISLQNCYHGSSLATQAATAMSPMRYSTPQLPGFIHVMNPDVYRGLWGGSHCRDSPISPKKFSCECFGNECNAANNYFSQFENTFKYSMPKSGRVAGFIAESIQGVGGVIQYPRTYLNKVYDFVRSKGGLCIADEVQTGFGRTGDHFWCFDNHNIEPDIVTLAKGIGNGFPMGAVITTSEIAKVLNSAIRVNTFGGNPVACAVGSAVLDVIEEERLQENSKIVGTHLLNRLSALMIDYPTLIGDVRGKGLMIGVDMISDPESKKPMTRTHVLEIFEDIKNLGILIGMGGIDGNVFRIKPAMCITHENADDTVETIKKALELYRNRHIKNKESVYFLNV